MRSFLYTDDWQLRYIEKGCENGSFSCRSELRNSRFIYSQIKSCSGENNGNCYPENCNSSLSVVSSSTLLLVSIICCILRII